MAYYILSCNGVQSSQHFINFYDAQEEADFLTAVSGQQWIVKTILIRTMF